MTISDEHLSAYIDGELPEEVAVEVEQLLASDPIIKARFDRLVDANAALKRAYDWVLMLPVPDDRIPAALNQRERQALDSNAGADIPSKLPHAWIRSWTTLMAPAVALVVGLCFGWVFLASPMQGGEAPILAARIGPDHALYSVLETGGSGRPVRLETRPEVIAEPILTFATEDGAFCREFRIVDESGITHGVACREDAFWNMTMAAWEDVDRPRDPVSGYAMAAGPRSSELNTYIDTLMAGAAFGAEAERSLIERGWTKD